MYSDARLAPQSSINTMDLNGGTAYLEHTGLLQQAGALGSPPAARATAIRASKAEALGHRPAGSNLPTAQPQMVQLSPEGGTSGPGPLAVQEQDCAAARPTPTGRPSSEGNATGRNQDAAAAEEQPSAEAIGSEASSGDESVPLAVRLQRMRAHAAPAVAQQKGGGPKTSAKKRGMPSDDVKPAAKPRQKRRLSWDTSVGQPEPSAEGSAQPKGAPNGVTAGPGGQKGDPVPSQSVPQPEVKPEVRPNPRVLPLMKQAPSIVSWPGLRAGGGRVLRSTLI